jgi:hypothetical protein
MVTPRRKGLNARLAMSQYLNSIQYERCLLVASYLCSLLSIACAGLLFCPSILFLLAWSSTLPLVERANLAQLILPHLVSELSHTIA